MSAGTLERGRAKRTADARARAAAIVEDVQWMAEAGESLTGAAARLSTTRDALDKHLRRMGRPDLIATMKPRDPQEPS